jgi:hypothetical protein
MRGVDDVNGVFVLPSGQDNQTCGSRAAPCMTIAQGVSRASKQGKTKLYVGPGTYVESVGLVAGLTVEGAWDVQGSVWSPDCSLTSANLANLEAPADASTTVLAEDLNGAATLRLVTVLSKDPSAVGPGESIYGILARGASTALTLDTVVVTVAAGGDGVTGNAGATGAPAALTGCTASDGAGGLPGSAASPSDGGTFTINGWAPGAGGPGGVAGNGHAGSAGGDGGCEVDACSCMPGNCTAHFTECAASGESGCGGAGGTGGQGGLGGGSSVALYVWGANVTCVDSYLTAGNGGNGGNGGDGGAGGAGSAGEPGAQLQCNAQCGVNPSGCVVVGAWLTADGGAPGGLGGAGGTGAAGGGGAGGWSCGYYVDGTGTVKTTATSFQVGSAGHGGAPSGAGGAAKGTCP